jgi:hypothetical protein
MVDLDGLILLTESRDDFQPTIAIQIDDFSSQCSVTLVQNHRLQMGPLAIGLMIPVHEQATGSSPAELGNDQIIIAIAVQIG